MHPSISQAIVPVLGQSLRKARGKHEKRLLQDGSRVAVAGLQEPILNQTLPDAVPVFLDNRHKSRHWGAAFENLNLTTATNLPDIT